VRTPLQQIAQHAQKSCYDREQRADDDHDREDQVHISLGYSSKTLIDCGAQASNGGVG
jgi:hypothetical protein